MGRGPRNPLKSAFSGIKDLLANAAQDRELAIALHNEAKKRLEALAGDDNTVQERDSLRSLMIESLKLAQSSKQLNLKLVDMYIKNQNAELEKSMEEAKKLSEEFLGG